MALISLSLSHQNKYYGNTQNKWIFYIVTTSVKPLKNVKKKSYIIIILVFTLEIGLSMNFSFFFYLLLHKLYYNIL